MRRQRSGPTFVPVTSVDLDRSHTSDAASQSAERGALSAALQQLNPDQRIAVAMRFYLDLEVDEIARRLGTRPGTIKSRLHRGINQLRIAWEGER